MGVTTLGEFTDEGNNPFVLLMLDDQQLSNLSTESALLPVDYHSEGKTYYAFYPWQSSAWSNVPAGYTFVYHDKRLAIGAMTYQDAEQFTQWGFQIQRLVPHVYVSRHGSIAQQESFYAKISQVEQMLDSVDTERLAALVADLSGEREVLINDKPYTIQTRYTRTDTPIKKATRYAYERFVEMALPTGYHFYTLPGSGEKRNVVAEQPGLAPTACTVLLIAHLDDTSQTPYTNAPGADDNASGAAGVLHAAEILSKYKFVCNIRYILFTGEEQGYYGSAAYASQLADTNERVVGVVNLDMIGYEGDGKPRMEIHTRKNHDADLAIAGLFGEVVDIYGMQLSPQIVNGGLSWSDHASFWDYDYPAVMVMEDFEDFTPYYHTTEDRLLSLDKLYMGEIVKAAIGVVAHLALPEFSYHVQLPLTARNFAQPLSTPTPPITPLPTVTTTPLPTSTPGNCENIIINGGFEQNAGWEIPQTNYPAGYSSEVVHSGSRAMRLGIVSSDDNLPSYSSVRQEVTLPSGASNIALNFWFYELSGDANTASVLVPDNIPFLWMYQEAANDAQYVLLLDQNEQIVATLLWHTADNGYWINYLYDLTQYAGQTLFVHFGVYNDGLGGITSAWLDDIRLDICP